jgi:[protein-PII] uridylyltransferase
MAETLSLKDMLQRERAEIRARHEQGALGGQIATALTDLYDRVIVSFFHGSVEAAPASDRARLLREMALVAVGGYGRGDLAPYSDIDLLFLHAPRPGNAVQDLVQRLVRGFWDTGVKLSQSVRTPSDALSFARRDLPHRTALTEIRLLSGSPALFAELQRGVHRLAASSSLNRFVDQVLEERRKEHQDYFATVNLLEPNVKKSPGGLRDVHLLRWIALPRYGTRDPQMLRVGGVLTPQDAGTLGAVTEFLSRIRNELHFRAGAAQDVLTRDEQVRIAKWLGYETQGALLGVERFMMQYHRHTTALHDMVLRFACGARKGTLLRRAVNRLLGKRVEGRYLLDRDSIAVAADVDADTLRRADVLLRLFDLARLHGVPVAHETFERVRREAAACEITPESRRRFLEMMGNPQDLGLLVRDLHRVGLLGRFIPAFEHARCLMQFNQYHKYTVDEHSIRALESATFRLTDKGPVGQAYRELRHKEVLHLALLLHDIGKGYEEDHSEVGRRIAEELSVLLGLGEHERHQLVYLVHKHLVMAHVATRRDISDPATLLQFCRSVGTVETLRMLYLLTVADTDAVAPGSLTSWKESLFTELYARALEALSGEAPMADQAARAAALRAELRGRLKGGLDEAWLSAQLEAMPVGYLSHTASEDVGEHLKALKDLGPDGVKVVARWLAEAKLLQLTVITRESVAPGLFSKIAGALAGARFGIVDAQIVTRADGIVLDTFRVADVDSVGAPAPARLSDLARRVEETLRGTRDPGAVVAVPPAHPTGSPTQVEIDTATSDRFTIVEVFADDRPGLLYTIARTLFELDLSVAAARIATSLDQVADVFYVVDRGGSKVEDPARLERIRKALLERIPSAEGAATPPALDSLGKPG